LTKIVTSKTPREMGYRMPAEWERQTAVWLQWPEKYPLPGQPNRLCYQMKMEKTWLLMVWEIHQHVKACILAQSEKHRNHILATMDYFEFDLSRIEFHITHMVDVWHRDSGPIFVVNDKGGLAVTDWNFNGWGTYAQWGEAERHLPRTVADILEVPAFKAPLVTEGGAIEVNGTGSLMATRSSIINANRNPGLDQQEIEQALGDYLGITNFIWLSGAPPEVCERQLGDGTDYHVDIAARFVGKNKVLHAWTDDESDPRYPYIVKHLEELQAASDEDGEPLTLIPLYLPEGGVHTIGDRHDPALGSGSNFTDASYANYLVTNDLVLIPAFGNAGDVKAQAVLAECFPERAVVPIPMVSLTAEGGAIHCVTQQQPARLGN
jgi:agmatine deiminase